MQIALLESGHARLHREGGAIASLTLHALVIGLAVQITAGVGRQLEHMRVEQVTFARLDVKEPPRVQAVKLPPGGGGGGATLGMPARGFQVLIAPNFVPSKLPDIDLTKSATDEADFSGRGQAGGVATGVAGGVIGPVIERPPVEMNETYLITQVEKPAEAIATNEPPRYPEALRAANIEGTVTATFVVDTTGVADQGSLTILESTHPLFTQEVRAALPRMRFIPAEIGGRRVRMLVQLPFTFTLAR